MIIRLGFWKAFFGFQTYLLYCLILGTAIGISQVRTIKNPPKKWTIVNLVFILFFYCLVSVLDDPVRTWTIVDYGSFIINLFVPFAR